MWERNGLWEMHGNTRNRCTAKKLEWIVCIVCTARYAFNWKHKCYHKFCVKCSTHYRDTDDHRCFICNDKHLRNVDDSDGETLSEGGLGFYKIEVPVQRDKRPKVDVAQRLKVSLLQLGTGNTRFLQRKSIPSTFTSAK